MFFFVGSLGASQLVLGLMSATAGHLSVSASQQEECRRLDHSMQQTKGPSVSLGLDGTMQYVAVCRLSMHQILRRAQSPDPLRYMSNALIRSCSRFK